MKIQEFVEEYKNLGDSEKISLLKEHITTKYLPYERKMVICNNIISSADYTPKVDVVNKKYYSPNTPMRFVFFCMSIIEEYTDLECNLIMINDEEKKDIIGGFNLLDEENVFESLTRELGREYKALDTVLKMMIDDTNMKECNLVEFLSTKLDSVKTLYDSSLSFLEKK